LLVFCIQSTKYIFFCFIAPTILWLGFTQKIQEIGKNGDQFQFFIAYLQQNQKYSNQKNFLKSIQTNQPTIPSCK